MNRATLILLILIILAAGGVLWFFWDDLDMLRPAESVEGTVLGVAASARVITIRTADGQEVAVALELDTRLLDEEGDSADLSYFRQGFEVLGTGKRVRPESMRAREVRVTRAPLAIVHSPQPNEVVSRPLVVTGEARGTWYFEASFPVRILDASGRELGVAVAQAQGEWMTTDYVPFKTTLFFDPPTTETGTLVLEKDNPSGLPEYADEVRIPVRFKPSPAPTGETMPIRLYFSSATLDPQGFSCAETYPVTRTIPRTIAPARAALELLLQGPTGSEVKDGYFTTINPGVKIQNLTIENGVARVDFDAMLEESIGGSCRVAAIRSQIVNTLKQFSSVREVVISINGRTEDILQP